MQARVTDRPFPCCYRGHRGALQGRRQWAFLNIISPGGRKDPFGRRCPESGGEISDFCSPAAALNCCHSETLVSIFNDVCVWLPLPRVQESLVQSSSYPPQTTELILGLPLIVYSDLGQLLPDSFSTSSELQSRFLAFAASPVASSDPQKRQAIAQALELALHLRLGRQPELMLKELLGPNGSSLYANAPTAIHRWVVFNQSVVCDRLCNELAQTINNDSKGTQPK